MGASNSSAQTSDPGGVRGGVRGGVSFSPPVNMSRRALNFIFPIMQVVPPIRKHHRMNYSADQMPIPPNASAHCILRLADFHAYGVTRRFCSGDGLLCSPTVGSE